MHAFIHTAYMYTHCVKCSKIKIIPKSKNHFRVRFPNAKPKGIDLEIQAD